MLDHIGGIAMGYIPKWPHTLHSTLYTLLCAGMVLFTKVFYVTAYPCVSTSVPLTYVFLLSGSWAASCFPPKQRAH